MTKRDLRGAALVLFAVAALVVAYTSPLTSIVERWLWSAQGSVTHGLAGGAIFIGVSALMIAIGIPRLFFAGVAGAMFGVTLGFTVAEIGTMSGCLITFVGARVLRYDYVSSRLGSRPGRVKRLLDAAREHGVVSNLLIRSAPVGNFFVTNLLMAVSRVSISDFLLGTFLGTVPATLTLALVGSGITGGGAVHVIIGGGFVLVWSVVYGRCVLPRVRARLGASGHGTDVAGSATSPPAARGARRRSCSSSCSSKTHCR